MKQPLAHSCFKRSQANRMGSCSSQPRELPTTTDDRVEKLTSQVVELSQQVEGLTEQLVMVSKLANFHEEEAGRAVKSKELAQDEVEVLKDALSEKQ